MQLFVLTVHCTSQVHCPVCRNKEGGRWFRESLKYELPDNKIDFECPYGKPWNDESKAAPVVEKPKAVENCPDCSRKAALQQMQQKTASPAANPPVRKDTGSRGAKKGCGCGRNG